MQPRSGPTSLLYDERSRALSKDRFWPCGPGRSIQPRAIPPTFVEVTPQFDFLRLDSFLFGAEVVRLRDGGSRTGADVAERRGGVLAGPSLVQPDHRRWKRDGRGGACLDWRNLHVPGVRRLHCYVLDEHFR